MPWHGNATLMPSSSLALSNVHQHVPGVPHTPLRRMDTSPGRFMHHSGQEHDAQTRPENVHARQDAHAGNPGRDRTPLCPVASRLPSLSPGTNRVATVPSISQTRSPALARPVAVVTDDELPPPYCHTAPKRTTRLHHLWPRHEARQHRLDVANTLRPSLAPSSLWNGDPAVDLPRAPRPPLEPIKGDPSATDFSRQSPPLPSLVLHRPSPNHIVAGSRPIAS
jgi:hypothetical protein